MDVALTEEADAWIQRYYDEKQLPPVPLRLAVRRTGCMGGRGHAYELYPDPRLPDDHVLQVRRVSLVVDPLSLPLLEHVAIRAEDTAVGRSLRVENSRATGRCPCGRHDLFD